VQGVGCRVQGAGCRVWAPGASSLLRVIEAAPNSKEAARDPPPPLILRARVQVMSPPSSCAVVGFRPKHARHEDEGCQKLRGRGKGRRKEEDAEGLSVVHLGRCTCHAINGRGDKSTRIPDQVSESA